MKKKNRSSRSLWYSNEPPLVCKGRKINGFRPPQSSSCKRSRWCGWWRPSLRLRTGPGTIHSSHQGRQKRMKRWKSMENDAFNCVCRKRRRESLFGHCFWFEYAVVVATVLCTWGAALPSLVVHCLAVDGGLWSQAAVAEERAENGDNQNEPRKDLSNLLSYYRNLICVSTWPPNNVDMAGSGYWIVRWRVVVVGFDKLHFNLGEFNLNWFQGNNWKEGFGKEIFLWFE